MSNHAANVQKPRWVIFALCFLCLAQGAFAQGALQVTTEALPGGVIGVVYPTQIMVASGGTAPYSWLLLSGSVPPGVTLSANGFISGAPTTAGTFSFTVRVTDSSATPQTATKTLSIAVTSALTITTNSLPSGVVDTIYVTQNLIATGGVAPYTWSISSGGLPAGLSVSSAGAISGTPAAAGSFNFTVSVTDNSPISQTTSKSFVVTIQPRLAIVSSSPLATGVQGVFYTQQLAASVSSSVTWSIVSGILPAGLALTGTGYISGTPSVAGTFEPLIQAANGDQTVQKILRIVINPALSITTAATLPDATLSNPYSITLAAAGGLGPYTWSNPGRVLPAGLSLSSAGVISGTPTGLGNFSFTVQVDDSFSPQQQTTRTFTLAIAAALTITTSSLPSAIQDRAYSYQFQSTGGAAPMTWVVSSGTLPSGLTLTTGGLLQGTAPAVSSESVGITVTDSRGTVSTKSFTVVVDPPISVLSAPGLSSTSRPAQQVTLNLSLASPHPSPLSGQLVLTFTSKAEVATNDPMTQFSTGSRTVDFTIPANSLTALFKSPVSLMIGTVAGTVQLKANIENGPSDLSVATIDVPAVPPQITNVEAMITSGGFDVLITGYSPSRRVTSVEFAFDIKTGGKTRRYTLTRNVDSQFSSWYQNAASIAFGSAFSFTQSFTIEAGNTIEAVAVTLKNAQGNTSSGLVHPQ